MDSLPLDRSARRSPRRDNVRPRRPRRTGPSPHTDRPPLTQRSSSPDIAPSEPFPRQRRHTIAELTSKQRAHLRSLAHHLKPVLHVGTDGVTEPVVESVREAFGTRELMKVKVHETAPVEVEAAAREIARGIDRAVVVQTIGRTMVLYRPFPEEPEIRLPE